MTDIVISKSTLLAYEDYARCKSEEPAPDALCGLLFEAVYLHRSVNMPSSEARDLGQWMEFWATGQTPAYDNSNFVEYEVENIPCPADIVNKFDLFAKVKMPELGTLKNGELDAKYRQAYRQAENFKMYSKAMGIKIIAVGEKFKRDLMSGTVDIRAIYDDREIIIDLKYSGLIDNKWDELGWDLNSLPTKRRQIAQAYHYHYVSGLPFYWFVFSSGKDEDAKFIPAEISDEGLRNYLQSVDLARAMMMGDIRNGFQPNPSLTACRNCPLKESCEYRVTFPITSKTIYL